MKFLQVHFFYEQYLEYFYSSRPELLGGTFSDQIKALIEDGFSGIHIIAPYMKEAGYEGQLIIANDSISQQTWLSENGSYIERKDQWINEVVRQQINIIKPDVLYLSEPLRLDSKFIQTLSHKPKVILGWRAANVPSSTDWSAFDVILSNLEGMREMALELGAKSTEKYWPGFPIQLYEKVKHIQPETDLVFCGQWTIDQHKKRNHLLDCVAKQSISTNRKFNCEYYLSGDLDKLTKEVSLLNFGKRYGLGMHQALRRGRIAFDARGDIGLIKPRDNCSENLKDLAGAQTGNMRILEVTGTGPLLLTEHFDNLEELFEIGREIDTFKDENELIKKINYYVSHPRRCEIMAERGQQRCFEKHSISKRVIELDNIIQKNINSKKVKETEIIEIQTNPTQSENISSNNIDDVYNLLEKAVQFLKSKNYVDAHDILRKAKSLKMRIPDLDYIRGLCFMSMDKIADARESFKEELRYFPNNQNAATFLKDIEERNGAIYDPNFKTGDKSLISYCH